MAKSYHSLIFYTMYFAKTTSCKAKITRHFSRSILQVCGYFCSVDGYFKKNIASQNKMLYNIDSKTCVFFFFFVKVLQRDILSIVKLLTIGTKRQ